MEKDTTMKQYDKNNMKMRAKKMAEEMGKNAMSDTTIIESIEDKIPLMKRGALKKIWDKVMVIWENFKSTQTPKSLKIILIGSLVYMISPIDVIPDFIPVAGLIDDVFVIGLAYTIIKNFLAQKAETIKENITNHLLSELNTTFVSVQKYVIIVSAIKLGIFIIAALLLFFLPRSTPVFIISGILMALPLLHGIITLIINARMYFHYVKIFFQQKSLDKTLTVIGHELIDGNIQKKHSKKLAHLFFDFWQEGKIPSSIVPDLPELKSIIYHHFKIRLLIFLSLFIVYTLVFIFILKPWLLSFSGYSIYEIYFLK